MKNLLGAAAVIAILTGGAIATAQAEGLLSSDRIQLAQMNSPGDALEAPGAGRGGNMRSSRMGGTRIRRHRQVRHHRRHH